MHRCVATAPRADFGGDDQVVRIGMQRLANDLVSRVRAVEIAGVNMVDARRGLAQHGDSSSFRE